MSKLMMHQLNLDSFITGSRVIMLSIIFEDIGWYDLKHSTMKIRSHIIMCIMWLPSQLHLLILLQKILNAANFRHGR
jgi:hypothetical protein